MSAFELLVDCVKDATKERDELAAALELKSNLYDAELHHSEAMRQRVRQLEAAIQDAICRLDDVDGTSLVSYDLENVLQTAGDSDL